MNDRRIRTVDAPILNTVQYVNSHTSAHARRYRFQFRAQLSPELCLHCFAVSTGSIARHSTNVIDSLVHATTKQCRLYLLHRLAIP